VLAPLLVPPARDALAPGLRHREWAAATCGARCRVVAALDYGGIRAAVACGCHRRLCWCSVGGWGSGVPLAHLGSRLPLTHWGSGLPLSCSTGLQVWVNACCSVGTLWGVGAAFRDEGCVFVIPSCCCGSTINAGDGSKAVLIDGHRVTLGAVCRDGGYTASIFLSNAAAVRCCALLHSAAAARAVIKAGACSGWHHDAWRLLSCCDRNQ